MIILLLFYFMDLILPFFQLNLILISEFFLLKIN